MIKKLFSHTIIYGLASQIGSIASIFALPIITKDLTEIDFGIWGILMAYTGAFKSLAFLGTNVVLSNAFFKMPKQYKWLWRQLYGFLLLWAIPFSLLLGTVLYFTISDLAKENTFLLLVLLIVPSVAFGPTAVLGSYYYQLNQRPSPIAIRTAIFALLTVFLNIYTISYLKLGYMGWAWSTFIVTILMNASYWYPVNITLGYKPIFNFKWKTIKKSLQIGLPTIPHSYSSFLLDSSDRIVMDQLNISVGDIGQYNVASKFGGVFRSLTLAANKAISPMMLRAYKETNENKARNLVFVLQFTIIILTFGFSIWSKEIFYLLINNDTLNKVYPLSIIIVMGYNYRPMYTGALNKLFYVEKTNLLWRISFIAGFLNIGLNFVLIPFFGFEIAAYTTFISLMYLGFSGHFVKKISQYNEANYYPMFWLTTIILLTISAYFAVELPTLYKFIISILLLIIGWIIIYLKRDSLKKYSND